MKIRNLFITSVLLGILIAGCQTGQESEAGISFDKYKVADGFEIQLAASEPLIVAPVAMDFDNKGRIWAVEMRGYMPNLAGSGEDAPNGRISILEDPDKNGRARRAKVFLDSLVLPRAIAHVYGGLLYAAPSELWFVEINDDKPGKRTLVDSLYIDGGNPENQPNGLIMGMDNWIYSANATARYQLRDGKWIKEATSFRGQWGITRDNFGRLYYNYNEIQLAGDYALPNTLINNPYLRPKEGINRILTKDQRIYPLHPTTVNRGYVEGILNKDSVLINFTAACGPLIYRGDQFPDEYDQNAFVCEPQANLIKRNILSFEAFTTTATQAWNDREFLASTDEGFRPVNALNAPDGAMYVVDMHRGVMQHRADETPYYRNGIAQKKLDTLLNMGRILRIKNKNKSLTPIPEFDKASGIELAALLKSKNGWTRDRAQQLLIYKQDMSAIPALKALAEDKTYPMAAIHALHTLNGLKGLSFEFLQKIVTDAKDPMVIAHGLLLLANDSANDKINDMAELANNLMSRNDPVIDLYLAISLGSWARLSKERFLPILSKLSGMHAGSGVFQEAVVSSLKDLEADFMALTAKSTAAKSPDEPINILLAKTIKNKQEKRINSIFTQRKVPMYGRQNGLVIYRSTCSTCHGHDGEGIQHIGPPLNGSEYVSGPTSRLGMIILNGLSGPIHVNGQLYEFNGAMPAFGSNFSDEDIAGIIDYLHNAFVAADPKLSYGRKSVKPEEIKILRNKTTGPLSEEELMKIVD